jgi:hypothetical protein
LTLKTLRITLIKVDSTKSQKYRGSPLKTLTDTVWFKKSLKKMRVLMGLTTTISLLKTTTDMVYRIIILVWV